MMTATVTSRSTIEAATSSQESPTVSTGASRAIAATRIALGFVFLWAFLDKLFGLGYSTPAERAWINGGSPTAGFLGHVDVGPFRSAFTAMAGVGALDWIFMLGLLGIGVALVIGCGLRIAAVTGIAMLLMMYAAEWPLAQVTAQGQPSGSTNPIVDYHVLYALVLIVLAATVRQSTWGLARTWQHLHFVARRPWLW